MGKFLVIIDRERCKGCHLCIETCPKKILEVSDEPNSWGYYPVKVTDEEACIGCGSCFTVCPDVAIQIKSKGE